MNPHGIIAHSPVFRERGDCPYRIVLRELRDEEAGGEVSRYVVHTELQNRDGTVSFVDGEYFLPSEYDAARLRWALKTSGRISQRVREQAVF